MNSEPGLIHQCIPLDVKVMSLKDVCVQRSSDHWGGEHTELLLETLLVTSWKTGGRRKVVVICWPWKLVSQDGCSHLAAICMKRCIFTQRHTCVCLQKHCIIDGNAGGGRCFAPQLNKSTPWINHQIKPHFQPGRGHQPHPHPHSASVLHLLSSF